MSTTTGDFAQAHEGALAEGARRPRLHDYGFFAALALVAILFYVSLRTIIVPILLGASIAVLARPAYERLATALGRRDRLASGLMTLAVTALVVVPIVILSWLLIQELTSVITDIVRQVQTDGASALLRKSPLPRGLKSQVTAERVREVLQLVLARIGVLATQVVERLSVILIGVFLFLLTLYYFLIDGPRWLDRVERLLPIERRHVQAFVHEFEEGARAFFLGTMATALAQGALATIGYWIFGVPQPLLWGSLTALMAFIPVVGTAGVWVPITVVVLLQGKIGHGVGLALWGFGISSIDNLLKPILLKGRMRLHPLLIFLSVLGGIKAFGAIGIFIGPLSAALFLSAVRIYDREYRRRLT